MSLIGLVVFVFDSLARSSITKVVSLDLILYGLWKQHDDNDNALQGEKKKLREEKIKAFDKVLGSFFRKSATVAPSS
jgi:hypothetical protein